MLKYRFKKIDHCEMCGSKTSNHKVLGQRLNQSQGFRPKKKNGISVSIQKCKVCNLIYSNPLPIPNNLQDHYGAPPEDYWIESYFNWTPDYFAFQINEIKELMPFQSGMKALDIGAGIGKAMKSLDANGFDTYGLEPSEPFYQRAINKMGIKPESLKFGAIEEVDYENNSFDFITFGAVFEHLYEPSHCLNKALGWLKQGGLIQIEVPSSKWLMPKFMNAYFKLARTNYVTNLSPMHSPFHLYEFDVKSFEELSKKLNFSIVKTRVEVCSIYHVPKFFHPILKWYMKKTNQGMQLTVYLKKN
ncbi:MAG: class I SAM-dependent methyltransferase [Crocinitomicaceae bacterium]|nr:class I SAM-dependent methyltransferase [Flavobacteriales bacterium]NQZ37375.1 class I SAM-dependent methyltransferase [Crocinitomicaceae bacterium]